MTAVTADKKAPGRPFTTDSSRSATAAREAKKAAARGVIEERIADVADQLVDAMITRALGDGRSEIAKQQAGQYLMDRLMGSPTQKVESLHMEKIDAEIEALTAELGR